MSKPWLFVPLAVLVSVGQVNAGVRRVWAVHDGEKVERDARDHPASRRNAAWDGRVARIYGARNEVIAFQVIVEADDGGVKELSLRLPGLVSNRDRISYQSPAEDPT